MQETGSKISLVTKIVSGSFSEHLSGSYDLFIYISNDEINFAVAEKKNSFFIAMESWESMNELPISEFLQTIISESEIFRNNNFKRVICCFGFQNGAIVPDALFTHETAKDQLLFSSVVNADDEIIVDEIQQIQAKMIFAVPEDVLKIITTHFRNAEIHHTATAVIGYLITNRRNSSEHLLHINLHKSNFEIYVMKGNQLILYNVFTFHSAEEMIYYLLFVCEQLHLNPETILLQFSGKSPNGNELYSLSSKYFRHTQYVLRPENYSYDFEFNELPSHFHFNLFSQLVCAS